VPVCREGLGSVIQLDNTSFLLIKKQLHYRNQAADESEFCCHCISVQSACSALLAALRSFLAYNIHLSFVGTEIRAAGSINWGQHSTEQ
jgi:hypothetical protein